MMGRGFAGGFCLPLGALTVVLGWAGTLSAHHDSAVGRIDTRPLRWVQATTGDDPRLESTVFYQFTRFDRFLDDRAAQVGSGSIDVHQTVLTSRWFMTGSTFLSAVLPFGVSLTREGERTEHTRGLGDLRLGLGRATQWQSLSITVEGNVMVPTGRYEPNNTVSVSRFVESPRGGLDLSTFDTRASLGADVWSAQAAVAISRLFPLATPRVRLFASQPLTETSDGIRWGADLAAVLDLSRQFGALNVGAGTEWRTHLRDRLMLVGTDTEQSVGRRDQLSALMDVSVALASDARCGVHLSLPAFQRAEMSQVLETYSGSARCEFLWAL